MVRLTNPDIDLGTGNKLEVLLRNSHNGTSSLNLQFGVFRLICTNGLVVCDDVVTPVRLRHVGEGIHTAVKDALMQIDQYRTTVLEQIQMLQGVALSQEQTLEFAKKALALTFPENEDRQTETNAKVINIARRAEDGTNSVWQVYNRVQENLVRGGFRLEGMNRNLRAIRDLDRDFTLNKGLWTLAVETAKAA
jgi:hypothetical protein